MIGQFLPFSPRPSKQGEQLNKIATNLNENQKAIQTVSADFERTKLEHEKKLSTLQDDRQADHEAIEKLTSKLHAQASIQAGQEKALRVMEHSDSEKDIRMTGLNWDQDVPREGLSRNTVSHILAKISGMEVKLVEQAILDFRVLGPPKQKELPNGRTLPRSSPVIIKLGNKTQRDYLLDKSRSHEDRSLPKLSVVFPERWQPEVNRLRERGAII